MTGAAPPPLGKVLDLPLSRALIKNKNLYDMYYRRYIHDIQSIVLFKTNKTDLVITIHTD